MTGLQIGAAVMIVVLTVFGVVVMPWGSFRRAGRAPRPALEQRPPKPLTFGKLVLAIVLGGWILYALIDASQH